MTEQIAVTIVADVKAESVARLRRLLAKMGKDAAGNEVLPLGELPDTHFARILLLDAAKDLEGQPLPAHLIYMSDADGQLEDHLEALVRLAPQGLDELFGHCHGYPAKRRASRPKRLAFLRAHVVDAGAAYVNTVGRTLEQVREDARLRDCIQEYLDGGEFEGIEPEAVRDAVRRFVAAREDLRWAIEPESGSSLRERASGIAGTLRLPLELAAISPVLVPLLPLWALALRAHELRDQAPLVAPTSAHDRRLAALEDHAAQNPFSAVGERKPGLVRRVTASSVLRLVDYGAQHIFNRGSLTGVKTIHFARWVFLDDERRMVFASSYDGSLESYMDDFINQVWWGLNAVFSNGVGWPKTRWLLFGGARDETAFKAYLRRREVPTQVWYSAYETLTTLNVENNAWIREGLAGELSREETETWLARL